MIKRYAYALDPGSVPLGTPCIFAASTGGSGSASFSQETENITGAPGAVVTYQVTTYNNNSNTMGEALRNSSPVFLNNTFTMMLDGSGNGSFVARVQGDPGQHGTVVIVGFTITSVDTGYVGSPSVKQLSKVF